MQRLRFNIKWDFLFFFLINRLPSARQPDLSSIKWASEDKKTREEEKGQCWSLPEALLIGSHVHAHNCCEDHHVWTNVKYFPSFLLQTSRRGTFTCRAYWSPLQELGSDICVFFWCSSQILLYGDQSRIQQRVKPPCAPPQQQAVIIQLAVKGRPFTALSFCLFSIKKGFCHTPVMKYEKNSEALRSF